MMKRYWLLLLLAALLLCPLSASAANMFYVSVSEAQPENGLPRDAVAMSKVGSKYYLFLPGAANMGELRIWTEGVDEAVIEKESYKNGDRLPAELIVPGETLHVKLARKTYKVQVMQGSEITAVFLGSASGSMAKIDKTKTYKEAGDFKMLDPDGAVAYDGTLDYVKLRGNTSAQFNKKGYAIKLSQKTDLAGMGKAKKYALISNARDHALIRNQIVFAMAKYAGLKYTPGCVQADVYLNHVYNGTYILQSKIEVGPNRVDIPDLEDETQFVNDRPLEEYPRRGPLKSTAGEMKYFDIPNDPEDITGGYLIEYENWTVRYKDEPCAYTTDRKKAIMLKAPEHASKAQMAYISGLIQAYENAIFADNGTDPSTGKHYTELMDLDSLALKYLLEEVCKNCDGNQSSQYYYKPSDSVSTRMFAGPAWDYDTTFGDYARVGTRELLNPEGLYLTTRNSSRYWWPQLYAKADFREAVRTRWTEKYLPAMRVLCGLEKDPANILHSIADYAEAVRDSAAMNFTLWPMRQASDNIASCGKTFQKNVDYLQNFVEKRMAFLDSEWGESEDNGR